MDLEILSFSLWKVNVDRSHADLQIFSLETHSRVNTSCLLKLSKCERGTTDFALHADSMCCKSTWVNVAGLFLS